MLPLRKKNSRLKEPSLESDDLISDIRSDLGRGKVSAETDTRFNTTTSLWEVIVLAGKLRKNSASSFDGCPEMWSVLSMKSSKHRTGAILEVQPLSRASLS